MPELVHPYLVFQFLNTRLRCILNKIGNKQLPSYSFLETTKPFVKLIHIFIFDFGPVYNNVVG